MGRSRVRWECEGRPRSVVPSWAHLHTHRPRLAAPTVPVVEAAAAAAALPSPHTDNMAAAEEETHGSAASRRDQSEAAAAAAGSGNPLPTRRRGGTASDSTPSGICLSAAMLGCAIVPLQEQFRTGGVKWKKFSM